MQISGVYDKTIFRNSKTNFTIFRAKLTALPTEDYEWLYAVCAGEIIYPLIGLPICMEGDFADLDMNEEKRAYDFPTFEFSSVEIKTFSADDVKLLPAFKGVGDATVEVLIQEFGSNVFDWANIPDIYSKLTAIDGIGPTKAKNIVEGSSYCKNIQDFITYCLGFGEYPYIDKDKNKPSELLNKLKAHPYEFGINECKMSFKTCDVIAKDNDYTANSWERVKFLILAVLEASSDHGNTCFPLSRVFNGIRYYEEHNSAYVDERVSEYVSFAVLLNSPEEVVPYIDEESNDTYFYLKQDYANERLLAHNIRRLQNSNIHFADEDKIRRLIAKVQQKNNIKYNESQKQAIISAVSSSGIKVLTGGPGTGKTTTLKAICSVFRMLHGDEKEVCLMAPTGRAAARMTEATGIEAKTLHRTFKLKTSSVSGRMQKMSSEFAGNFKADLVICDESSMLDTEWSAFCLASLKGGVTLVLVGDIDQLPSVGCGRVLHDLIDSGAETTRLEVNYRSGDLSTISKNAMLINSGTTELIQDDTFFISKCPDKATMKSRAKQIFYKEFNPEDPFGSCQILCAVKSGACGVFDYNRMAQASCNKSPTLLETEYCQYKVGDKIIQLKNDYDSMVFNGDLAVIKSIDDGEITADFGDGKEVVYGPDSYHTITHAYALSIHKSQGSEYNTVIIILPEDTSGMNKRNILYTAVTRAKKKVYIFYTGSALENAIANNSNTKRETRLTEMLTKEI